MKFQNLIFSESFRIFRQWIILKIFLTTFSEFSRISNSENILKNWRFQNKKVTKILHLLNSENFWKIVCSRILAKAYVHSLWFTVLNSNRVKLLMRFTYQINRLQITKSLVPIPFQQMQRIRIYLRWDMNYIFLRLRF